MKIQDITVFSYNAMYSGGTYSMSGGRLATGQPSIVLRIRADTGIEGWGETAPLGSNYLASSFAGELAALQELCPQILGMDPQSPQAIVEQLDRLMLGGIAAKSVIDFACWDLFGKSVNLPTYKLLGGQVATSVPAFSVIGIGSPEDAVRKAVTEHSRGVTAMQLKVGGVPTIDAARVRAIRQAIPDDVEMWADANAGWNLEQALTFARALGSDMTVPLEQPCRSLTDCAEVGRRTGVPIVLDESILGVADLLMAHAAGITGINVKPSRVGGFIKARTIRDMALALDMMVVIDDTWGCALTTAQNLQLAASCRGDRLRAVDCFAEWTNPIIADIPRMQSDGRVKVPCNSGNGHGAVNVEMLGELLFTFEADAGV